MSKTIHRIPWPPRNYAAPIEKLPSDVARGAKFRHSAGIMGGDKKLEHKRARQQAKRMTRTQVEEG